MKDKKSSKRIISALLIIALIALSFTACGLKKNSSDADAQTQQSDTASQSSSTDKSEDVTDGSSTSASSTSASSESTAPKSTQGNSEAQPQQTGKTRDLSTFKDKKLIAITFDDGPAGAESTGKLLDNLDKYNARVTFFVVGNRVANHASILKREYEMGNQVASHSFTHANLAKLSESGIKDELDKTNEAIKKVIGVEPTCIRPPYGSLNDTVKKAANMHIITWSIDTLDWKNKNADTVCNNIVSKAFDGAIVLLHDLYPTSVDGALKAMEILKDQGYAFVTVEEMAKLRGVEMNNTSVYNNFKPQAE